MLIKAVRHHWHMAYPVLCKRCGKPIKKARKNGEICQPCLNKRK